MSFGVADEERHHDVMAVSNPGRQPMRSDRDPKTDRNKTPTWLVMVLWGICFLESAFFGAAAIDAAPSWFAAANSVRSVEEFGWAGAATTAILAGLSVASAMWGLMAFKARAIVRSRL